MSARTLHVCALQRFPDCARAGPLSSCTGNAMQTRSWRKPTRSGSRLKRCDRSFMIAARNVCLPTAACSPARPPACSRCSLRSLQAMEPASQALREMQGQLSEQLVKLSNTLASAERLQALAKMKEVTPLGRPPPASSMPAPRPVCAPHLSALRKIAGRCHQAGRAGGGAAQGGGGDCGRGGARRGALCRGLKRAAARAGVSGDPAPGALFPPGPAPCNDLLSAYPPDSESPSHPMPPAASSARGTPLPAPKPSPPPWPSDQALSCSHRSNNRTAPLLHPLHLRGSNITHDVRQH